MKENEDVKYLNKFYKKAVKLKKENLTKITDIETIEGVFLGFTYTENNKLKKIFLVEQDVAIEEDSVYSGRYIHELGLYELN